MPIIISIKTLYNLKTKNHHKSFSFVRYITESLITYKQQQISVRPITDI